jgi:hypothetical protein
MPEGMIGSPHSATTGSSSFSAPATAVGSNQNLTNIPFSPPESPNGVNRDGSATGRLPDTREWDDNTVEGWPKLAVLMAKNPDFSAFSRFSDLNVKSLLYYQVQLTLLRKRLQDRESLDAASDERTKPADFASYVDFMIQAEDKEKEQFKIIQEMRKVLKEYSECNRISSVINGCLIWNRQSLTALFASVHAP